MAPVDRLLELVERGLGVRVGEERRDEGGPLLLAHGHQLTALLLGQQQPRAALVEGALGLGPALRGAGRPGQGDRRQQQQQGGGELYESSHRAPS